MGPEPITIFPHPLTFPHGIHPPEYKDYSNDCPIERMPFTEEYILPLSQHIGAPSKPLVKKGDKVRRGQKIADPGGYVSVALHAPVDGTVQDISLYPVQNGQDQMAIKIKADPYSQQLLQHSPVNFSKMEVQDFIRATQESGLVGLGGAAFPAHVKFDLPEGKECHYLMLNGCECEPFLTSDDRLMREYGGLLLEGMMILAQFVEAKRIFIAIERNKPEAIANLKNLIREGNYPIEVVTLQVKYPQGAEKMMITAILGEEVPSGKLPIDLGVLVSNVGTVVALAQYFHEGQPLIERVITVTGSAVKRPANVMVPLGTSIRELVEWCGGTKGEVSRVLFGGPMMGVVQKSLDVPVVKGTSGILLLSDREVRDMEEYNCIRCGRCVEACPLYLNPCRMGLLAKKGLWEEMEEYNVMDCFECASCSFVCPSSIPLVQSFRVAKGFIREQKAREKAMTDG
ncbi:MAG: electron transport complex subunit RsxC [Cyclobacteriaceae bacterium]|nr:electron transport complex subunit RsxC [Cyclobacteriaceae bacterium]